MKIKTLLILYIIFIFISFNACNRTNLIVNYKDNQGHYLNFKPNNEIEFVLSKSSCFGDAKFAGFGNFNIKKERIIINTKSGYLSGSSSSYSYIRNTVNTPKVYDFVVVDELERPIMGVSISYMFKNENIGVNTDSDGIAKLNLLQMPDDSLLNIFFLGYQQLRIKLKDIEGGTFKIKLKEGLFRFIKNKKIILKYKINGDTIFCNLIKNDKVLKLTKQNK